LVTPDNAVTWVMFENPLERKFALLMSLHVVASSDTWIFTVNASLLYHEESAG
jgi:hypothetical protein